MRRVCCEEKEADHVSAGLRHYVDAEVHRVGGWELIDGLRTGILAVQSSESMMGNLSGILVVDKPAGCSSMDVVRRVRRAGGGVKTGHAGTLDPLATGVLVCCLGSATRMASRIMGLTKVYWTEIDLSAFTDTDDREGQRKEVTVAAPPDTDAVRQAFDRFIGEIEQVPPIYSAVHVNGQRAYRLARKGKDFELPSRTVRIDQITLLDYCWPLVTAQITCGKGTYIRSLARDLGTVLHTGGHLASLRRLAVGYFDLSMALTMSQLDRPLVVQDLVDADVSSLPLEGYR